MTHYAVHVDVRFVVEADSPEEALKWLNDTDQELEAACYGHGQRAVLVDDERKLTTLRSHTADAWYAALGDLPMAWQWSPSTWPARAFTLRVLRTCARKPLGGGSLVRPARAAAS